MQKVGEREVGRERVDIALDALDALVPQAGQSGHSRLEAVLNLDDPALDLDHSCRSSGPTGEQKDRQEKSNRASTRTQDRDHFQRAGSSLASLGLVCAATLQPFRSGNKKAHGMETSD